MDRLTPGLSLMKIGSTKSSSYILGKGLFGQGTPRKLAGYFFSLLFNCSPACQGLPQWSRWCRREALEPLTGVTAGGGVRQLLWSVLAGLAPWKHVLYKRPVLVDGITPSAYLPLHAILCKPKASSIYSSRSSSYANY